MRFQLRSRWTIFHPSFFSLGQLRGTPTLSVLPGSRMSSGEDVTLVCQSLHRRDSFVLSKEGTTHSLLYLRSVLQDKLYQAKFFMRNVTFTHGGTYKCYSSEDLYPYMLSYPSNAVELVVSGKCLWLLWAKMVTLEPILGRTLSWHISDGKEGRSVTLIFTSQSWRT